MITNGKEIYEIEQYSIDYKKKSEILLKHLIQLTEYHKEHSASYKNILDSLNYDENNVKSIKDIPFLPVSLFKEMDLHSLDIEDIFKVLTSSGTTGQSVSKIFLDKETSILQTKALASIVTKFVGPKRLPMIIIDSKNVLKNRNEFSARGAGILGLSNFGRDHLYILDENMELDIEAFAAFMKKYEGQKILFFGFTFMIWLHLISELKKKNMKFPKNEGILIHSGGWKKLAELSVSNEIFKETVKEYLGIESVHNFYGMVEQVGGVYMECNEGYFHSSNFSEIIVRNETDWSPQEIGMKGIIQTLSILPKSYPGHSLLTEDVGIIIGRDDCKCGLKGCYFQISGRIPKVELRGCSDTYQTKEVAAQ
jgi:phenylacetate-coenzyme A ligase PaaK-like adenylate-forming protein